MSAETPVCPSLSVTALILPVTTPSRGRMTNITTEGGAEHIDLLAERYTGRPYQWYGGRDQVRVILTITADSIHSMDR